MREPWKDQDDEPEYSLVLPFIDQSPEFCHGFECGEQYGRMKHGPRSPYTHTVHTENLGQLRAIAATCGWSARFEPLDDTWSVMHAEAT